MKKKRRKFEVNIDTFWKRKEELESSTQCLSEGKEKSEQVFSNEDIQISLLMIQILDCKMVYFYFDLKFDKKADHIYHMHEC